MQIASLRYISLNQLGSAARIALAAVLEFLEVCSEVGDDQIDRGQAFLPESSGFAVVRIGKKITDSEGKFFSYN